MSLWVLVSFTPLGSWLLESGDKWLDEDGNYFQLET